jgi:hypothetical protein
VRTVEWGGHDRKYFRVHVTSDAIIARREKQSWFHFIDWSAIAFTICNVQARSFTMRQSDPLVVREAARLISAPCAPCCAETMAESCTTGSVRGGRYSRRRRISRVQ